MKPVYSIGKYSYPGTGYYVLRNGFVCFSGAKSTCENFIKNLSEFLKEN